MMGDAADATWTKTVALTGDALIAEPVVADSDRAWTELLACLKGVDAAFTNLEVPINDGVGYPTCRDTGTWCGTSRESLDSLLAMGFSHFACAHNHSLDWAEAGLLRTRDNLHSAGVAYAGIGSDLSAARRPAVRNGVALVSMTATYPEAWRAGDGHRDVPGRPGVNPLAHSVEYAVPEHLWPALNALNSSLQLDAHHRRRVRVGFALPDPDGTIRLLGTRFVRGPLPKQSRNVDRDDAEANLAAIRAARREARVVIASIHSHEMGEAGDEQPADFFRSFARECIEAGADVVVGHGPHLLRGIEMHCERPIFYSLGNFFFENERMARQPLEYYRKYGLGSDHEPDQLFDARSASGGFASDRRFWQSVVATCRFSGSGLEAVDLHPIALGFGKPREERGVPRLVLETSEARGTIEHMAGLSREFGVEIVTNERVGNVVI